MVARRRLPYIRSFSILLHARHSLTPHAPSPMKPAELLQEYKESRPTTLTAEQFELLLYLVPVMIVATSDANVDTIEMGYLRGVISESIMELTPDELSESELTALNGLYQDEMNYLLRNMRYWEDKLLEGLKALMPSQPDMLRRLKLRMQAVAESSKGVNAYEKEAIARLQERLGIA